MRALKVISISLLGSLVLLSGCGLKKMVKKQNTVTYAVNPNPLEVHGGKMVMELKGNYPPKYFNKKANVTLVPVLKSNEDGSTLELAPIRLKGEKATGEGQVISYKNGGSFSVTQTVDYKPAFVQCTLNGTAKATKGKKSADFEEVYFGEGTLATAERVAASPTVAYKKDAGTGTYLYLAEHGYDGTLITTQKAGIYFEKNKDNLNWSLPLNKKEENKKALSEVMTFIDQHPNIISIDIDGWASPEGELNRNNELSSNRSKAAKDWFSKEYDKYIKDKAKKEKVKQADIRKEYKFNLADNGEDWDGFLAAVGASSMKEKDQVLNVIRSQADRDQRQQQIRNMIAIYNEIDNMLPDLRRAIIKINASDAKSDEEISRLAITEPTALTLPELLYAASLTSDNKAKKAIYEATIKQFPNDFRAYNDLAAIEASEGNYDKAKELLDKANSLAPNDGLVWNNIGVLALMQNDYTAAAEAFAKAEKAGISESYNNGIIDLKNGDYAAANTKMSAAKCKYNKALLQVLAKNYTEAKATLDCLTPKTAEAYYLLAIVGARTQNANDVYTNLKEACALNAKYKNHAKKDLEFKKYRNDSEFQAAIK
ncbi:MAG: tetratricopeptide repeat protein [Bacteroidales bacterium]|jgi:Tfp pilus assembly protein PilF/outer membrane protein OmpA-like peptidoglycan-associated protein|nr:tetratricopeptide repeat protein [Bacteroidales bacterium]